MPATQSSTPVPGLPEGRTPGSGLPSVSVVTALPRAGAVVVLVSRAGPDGTAVLVNPTPAGLEAEVDLPAALLRQRAKGTAGELIEIPLPATGTMERLLVVGLGRLDAGDSDAEDSDAGDGGAGDRDAGRPDDGVLRRAGAALARRAKDHASLVVDLRGVDADASLLSEAVLLASYAFTLRAEAPARVLEQVYVVVDETGRRTADEQRSAVERATTRARATVAARDLVNAPSLVKTPQWLAERAQELLSRLAVRVRDEDELAEEGFGGTVAVGQGSSRPPRFIEASYDGTLGRGSGPHVVLVGKGITFDTGGLSLKRGDGMLTMKMDMGGAAAVLATLRAVADLALPLRVTVLVSAAENMPSGDAQRPGDVITQYGGRTVEVLNTDAEGRLVLADALAYADTVLDADVIVDVATLTGAMPVALGKRHAGLFCSDDALAEQLLAASAASGERVWRMPLVEDYRAALDSPTADLRNIGDPRLKLQGGSITAALFLQEFTGGRPWAHLDIAGPAWAGADEDEVTKGGTGYGVRLLVHWLEGLAART